MDKALTYWELNRQVNRFAHALRSTGFNLGDRIAILLPNIPQFIIAFYGALKAGSVAVLIPPPESPDEWKRQIAESAVHALIALTPHADLARSLQVHLNIPPPTNISCPSSASSATAGW
ncbi:AMP-binding protein [Thermoflexus sp.]|uniref:AMP-binding protein n=1 Tax=Thermoflexus sp. TaxID=1969742 RepID=UPI0025E0292F|nr:class I adenylate-forming enzyme family protein [Thermoflexus sp.]MCS6963878.1 acyl--CoA ligase [Thermoflexus sp.]MCS7352186.1 acyl--CoA ligase [Thermoflexus sp.]MCX7691358.1 acyl--CoA ligase [Thermoflexus sp.]MDW8181647.1 class I adenylate-forming enzyme family protein [Anaerolineae bacterium]